MEIEIQKADIFDIEAEAMVYPGTTDGELNDKTGKRLKKLVGKHLAHEIGEIVPIAVGAATVLEVTGLNVEHLIYSPLVAEVVEKIIVENVRRCTRAALVATCVREFESIALPVIRPNSEDMSITETTRAMIDELRAFRSDHEFTVHLVDPRENVVDILRRSLEVVR